MVAKKRSARRRGLGLGLAALLRDTGTDDSQAADISVATFQSDGVGETLPSETLPLASLTPNRFQPRARFDPEALKALAASIRERGTLTPILARPAASGGYEIVAGERRWRAAQMAGLTTIPARVMVLDDLAALELALVENLQREDLDPVEEARGYARLGEEFGMSKAAIARAVGRSRPHVANALRVLDAPTEALDALLRGEVSAGHVRAALASRDPARLVRRAAAEGLSVRATERLAATQARAGVRRRSALTGAAADAERLARRLSDALGLPVRIVLRAGGGDVRIVWRDYDQLEEISNRLRGGARD